MNREEKVRRLVKQKFNWVVGGLENSLADKHIDEMPCAESIKASIHYEVMNAKELEIGPYLMPIQKDIRFLGTEKIKQIIDEVYEKNI